MLEKLVLHGVTRIKYDPLYSVYKVTTPNRKEVDIDGFIDEVHVIGDHASVTFSVSTDQE